MKSIEAVLGDFVEIRKLWCKRPDNFFCALYTKEKALFISRWLCVLPWKTRKYEIKLYVKL